MRVTVLDLGVGNLHSIVKALAFAGVEAVVESNPKQALAGDALVLPGVGAFEPAAARIAPQADAIRGGVSRGMPVLGICLGMQLLFERSDEGSGSGLGIFRGSVVRLRAASVPQIGWNEIEAKDPLFEASQLTMAYYANSFACRAVDLTDVVAWSTHENDRFPAAVRRGSVVGVQFHPEKSSQPGLRFLRAFFQEAAR
jgi:glutamine amidotransferase